MFDRDAIYNVLDAHFVNHLVRDGEVVPAGEAESADAGADATGAEGQALALDMPDNMIEDLLDELEDTLEELHGEYDYPPEALGAIAVGFIDGVLAYSNGSYSSFEDAYFEDAQNGAYAAVDEVVTDWAGQFEGNRDWGEAAKGYLRHAVKLDEGEAPEVDEVVLQAQAQGFVYGADLCEDYEWKVIQASSGCVMVTDEDAIEEFSMRQLEKSGAGGGLFERVFNALGIDLNELEAALGGVDDDDAGDDDGEAPADAGAGERDGR